MDTNVDSIPVVAKPFLNWVFSPASGIQCTDVEVRHGPHGFGLFAKETIRRHACAIAIPKNLIIIADNIRTIPEYAQLFATPDFPHFTAPETLALFYCLERFFVERSHAQVPADTPLGAFLQARSAKPKSSRKSAETNNASAWLARSRSAPWFRSYLDMLPRQFGTPLEGCFVDGNISDTQVDMISASLPHDTRPFFSTQITELRRLIEQFQLVFGDASDPQLFLWAWAVVNTRSVYIDVNKLIANRRSSSPKHRDFDKDEVEERETESTESIGMIPFFDLVNHGPTAQCEGEFNSYTASFRVTAERELVRAGDEITICYGPHDNARLWLEYGFRLERNVYNRVSISLDMFILLARQSGLAVGGLSHHHEEILREADFNFTIFGDDRTPSYAARKCCQIALMPRRQLTHWRRFVYNESYAGPDGALAAELAAAVRIDDNGREPMDDQIDQLMRFVLVETHRHLSAKASGAKTPDDMRSLWWDRVHVLDVVIENLERESAEVKEDDDE